MSDTKCTCVFSEYFHNYLNNFGERKSVHVPACTIYLAIKLMQLIHEK